MLAIEHIGGAGCGTEQETRAASRALARAEGKAEPPHRVGVSRPPPLSGDQPEPRWSGLRWIPAGVGQEGRNAGALGETGCEATRSEEWRIGGFGSEIACREGRNSLGTRVDTTKPRRGDPPGLRVNDRVALVRARTNDSRGWTRTSDKSVNSRLLYQLSYAGSTHTEMSAEQRKTLVRRRRVSRTGPPGGAIGTRDPHPEAGLLGQLPARPLLTKHKAVSSITRRRNGQGERRESSVLALSRAPGAAREAYGAHGPAGRGGTPALQGRG